MKMNYEKPVTEAINLVTKGYICAGEDIFFGGSGHVQNQTGNDGQDEAKRANIDYDMADFQPWENYWED